MKNIRRTFLLQGNIDYFFSFDKGGEEGKSMKMRGKTLSA